MASIGNILRHDYESIAAAVIWKLAHDDLEALRKVCSAEPEATGRED
ncbi:MAG: HepT-like ribonuclease domain-containing protein [Roseiarcus sp.]